MGPQPIEQVVLGPLELLDVGRHLAAVAAHRGGVLLRLAVIALGQRRLGHHRPEASVVGFVGEDGELLVGHSQLGAELPEPIPHVDQLSLDARTAPR